MAIQQCTKAKVAKVVKPMGQTASMMKLSNVDKIEINNLVRILSSVKLKQVINHALVPI